MLRAVNGSRVVDLIDYLFHRGEPSLDLEVLSVGTLRRIALQPREGEDPGIGLKHFKLKHCGNNCVFCFVAQLPKGMRKTLYFKDEDYRMSFLYGNYITMTNLAEKDRERIARLRLSPLYISVHSTDRKVRNALLGNPKAGDIMKELAFLKESRLRAHVQIVLCPGMNDGENIKKTIRDLYSFYPYVASIAVVPVGLTSHRRVNMRPVLRGDALAALYAIEAFQRRFMKKHGEAIVFAADELYIKADVPFPPAGDYGDLPQIENGVGLVPVFISEARRAKPEPPARKRNFLTFTGTSFYPFLKKHLVDRLNRLGHNITLLPVENAFFGESVTVTGLLTGRDVLRALSGHADTHDILLIPDIVLREGGDMFLDDVSVADLQAALGVKAVVIEASAKGLASAIGRVSEN
jgi:putative radical SAM enzyme (TIGR03279 family)